MSKISFRRVSSAPCAASCAARTTVVPQCDLVEDTDGLTLYCSLPGVAAKDIALDIEKDRLHLRCTAACQPPAGKIHALEFNDVVYERRFTVPSSVNTAAIEASYRGGLLTVRLPFAAPPSPCRIIINSGNEHI